ncbi:hypothetical protein MINTM019_05540 [Mycobacterium paraintracellulare]|uniref:Uncharacterized protein n=1 Tax=Mycobacterium paraintracellulare TaxID=1138383 RepID=A0ABN6AMH9_9MYCO|nr:hypothetical protein MPRI_22800 [Mycobacterium paraintracellulare]BCO60547.1 hypothetical protein MINTM006_04970 [Mycobacterium intracellulare]BCO39663.1 hypothetical protein MINTM001_08020 [Mycobacterium paraintracellulare]BCO50131.1 hypothetical protein MINTM003_05720 [Mycobacterium paraintracellulare]BCO82239.1 hypothetical protein MINTM011_05740 [Mycobacterium paraintracellulare]
MVQGSAPPARVKIRVTARCPTAPSVGEADTAIWSDQHGVGASTVSAGMADAGHPSTVAAA